MPHPGAEQDVAGTNKENWMKKRELAQTLSGHADIDPKVAMKAVDGLIEVIHATVAKGEDVVLNGLAKFSKVKRPARMGRNPLTGQPIKIKAKTAAKVTALKGYK